MIILVAGVILTLGISVNQVQAQSIVPEWVKRIALWYGEGQTSDAEFLDAIKFLIENEVIVIEGISKDAAVTSNEEQRQDNTDKELLGQIAASKTMNIIIPNGNSLAKNSAFFIPLNAVVKVGTLVIWVNDDIVGHTIQSQDEHGNIIPVFNSDILTTGQRFAHTFDEVGEYNYFCTIHPWRVGTVTVVE